MTNDEKEKKKKKKRKKIEAEEKTKIDPSSFSVRREPPARIVGVNELITEREESRVCFSRVRFRFSLVFNSLFLLSLKVVAHVTLD